MSVFRRSTALSFAALAGMALATSASLPAAAVEIPMPTVNLTTQTQLGADFQPDPALQALLPEAIRASGEIPVGMVTNSPPVNFAGTNPGEVRGLIPDLATAVQQLLGVKFVPTIYPTNSAQLLALNSNRAEIAFSSTFDTKEREKTYDFVNFGKTTSFIIVAPKAAAEIKKVEDLCGKPYGSVKGSIDVIVELEKICADAKLPAPEVLYMNDSQSMVLAGESGRIVAYLYGLPYLIWNNSQGKQLGYVDTPKPLTAVMGLTFAKDDRQLAEAVLAAFKKLDENGYLAKVFEHWALTPLKIEPGINLGHMGTLFE